MTATIVSFDGTSTVLAKTALETLAPAAADHVVVWVVGNKCFAAKTTI